MDGPSLTIENAELGPIAVRAFPATSDHAELNTEILADPLPLQPVIVTVRVLVPVPVTLEVQPLVVPLI